LPSARRKEEYVNAPLRGANNRSDMTHQAALVTYVTAGYPTPEETVDVMLGMEAGGAGEFWCPIVIQLLK
jgi:hypothetical protein